MKTYLAKTQKRRKILTEALRKDLKDEAYRLVQLLKTKSFKLKRVYLFGSVTKDKPLAPWSDIDLAIEGLPGYQFLKLYAYLLQNSKFSIDIKPLEELNEQLKEKITKTGEIIYERR